MHVYCNVIDRCRGRIMPVLNYCLTILQYYFPHMYNDMDIHFLNMLPTFTSFTGFPKITSYKKKKKKLYNKQGRVSGRLCSSNSCTCSFCITYP